MSGNGGNVGGRFGRDGMRVGWDLMAKGWSGIWFMTDRGRGILSTFSFEIEMGDYCTGSFPRLGNLSDWGTWATVSGSTLTIGIP